MVALTYWLIWCVVIGAFPVIFGYIYVVLDDASHDVIRLLARGDLLILAVVLAGGGLAQILSAEDSPLLNQMPILKPWLAGFALTICLFGGAVYGIAFHAEWTQTKQFDYGGVAVLSCGFFVASIVSTACCIVAAPKESDA